MNKVNNISGLLLLCFQSLLRLPFLPPCFSMDLLFFVNGIHIFTDIFVLAIPIFFSFLFYTGCTALVMYYQSLLPFLILFYTFHFTSFKVFIKLEVDLKPPRHNLPKKVDKIDRFFRIHFVKSDILS